MYDVAIIGCGVVGAAVAYELARYRVSTVILEAENDVAAGTTKANSAILHAGYDPEPGTLMAKLNVRGVVMAEQICRALDVPRRQCGSLVLAFDDADRAHLQRLLERGQANGVPGLEILTGAQVRAREPNLSPDVVAALWAPSAAIVSPWEYALAMAETAVRNGTTLLRSARVTAARQLPEGWQLDTTAGAVEARFVVNAAGLGAEAVHNLAAPPAFHTIPTRGEYYLLDKSEGTRVGCTVFPCPTRAGKGVLVTPTVHGNCLIGPTAEPEREPSTATTARGLEAVAAAARRSVPGVDLRAAIRSFAGVRAVTDRPDFIVEFAAPGFLDLAGIKSPGLSAAPAIGEYAAGLLAEAGLSLARRDDFINHRQRLRFRELSPQQKNDCIRRNAAYGRVICRCETVTEGEILDCLHTPIPPVSVDGVKRRVNAGMGRCQGGFCGPRVVEILSRKLGLPPEEILQEKAGSRILFGPTKQSREE